MLIAVGGRPTIPTDVPGALEYAVTVRKKEGGREGGKEGGREGLKEGVAMSRASDFFPFS